MNQTIGWREWVALPDLDIAQIKAKIDSGARTSALHAFEVDRYTEDDRLWVRFDVHPLQRDTSVVTTCRAPVLDERSVRDSGGHIEQRFVIETQVRLGDDTWPIEMTLTARDDMGFRMLLGRTAIRGRYVIDPSRSYLIGKRRRRT